MHQVATSYKTKFPEILQEDRKQDMRWNEYSSFLFCLTPLSYKVSSLQLVTNHLRAPFSFEEMYLNVSQKMMDLRKGTACSLESYSPFIENICIIIIRCYFPQKFRGYSGIFHLLIIYIWHWCKNFKITITYQSK